MSDDCRLNQWELLVCVCVCVCVVCVLRHAMRRLVGDEASDPRV